jgi:polysaccharide pyruvyl transferase WcaK-like protein
MADVMDELAHVGAVVATRYHNVMGALRLSRPTVSVGYAKKHDVLMVDMGLPEFCLSVHDFDLDGLIARFKELQDRLPELRSTLLARNEDKRRETERHFADLSSALFGARSSGEPPASND